MIEKNLEELKKVYQETKMPDYLIYNGWADLKFKLPNQQNNFFRNLVTKGLVFASICLLVSAGLIKSAQAAKPGDLLFPIKDFTQNVKAKITGNYQEIIQDRAQDVIDLSSKSQDKLNEAIRVYKQTVKDSQDNTKDSEKSQELKNTIEHQNEEIQKIENQDRSNSGHTNEDQQNVVQGVKTSTEQKNLLDNQKHKDQEGD